MRLLFTILLLSSVAVAMAQTKGKSGSKRSPNVQFLNPPALSQPTGYTHVVIASGGRTVLISGQVALDAKGALVGKDDYRAQTRQVFENLKAALAAAGGSFENVVKLNYYVLDASQVGTVREVRNEYLTQSHPPASTFIQVGRLARPEFLIEVEAIAVVPE